MGPKEVWLAMHWGMTEFQVGKRHTKTNVTEMRTYVPVCKATDSLKMIVNNSPQQLPTAQIPTGSAIRQMV
jgi:hypothetical protein